MMPTESVLSLEDPSRKMSMNGVLPSTSSNPKL